MTASTPAHIAAPSAARPNDQSPISARQTPREACPAVPGDQIRKQESDRVFEARLRWFLAVSRAA